MRKYLANLLGIAAAVCVASLSALAKAQTLTRGPEDSKWMGSVYVESLVTGQYGFLSSGRIKEAYLFTENWNAYAGAAFLRQDRLSGDIPFYSNSVSPLLGVQGSFWEGYLGLFAEARVRWDDRDDYQSANWDPRLGIYSGHIYDLDKQPSPLFAEYYAESIFVPDIDGRPVTTGWVKFGKRFYPSRPQFITDLYGEIYASKSYNPNLGRDIAQARVGTRLIYTVGTFSLSGLFYYTSDNKLEGLLVLGGTF